MTCPTLNRFLAWDHTLLAQLALDLHNDNQMLLKRLRSLTCAAEYADCATEAGLVSTTALTATEAE